MIEEFARQCVEYILDNEKERNDYIDWCIDNNLSPKEENYTDHVYGAARAALGLGPLEKI